MNALHVRTFRNYLVANTISYLGNWIERLALGWIAWETSHSAFWTGVVAVGHIIPAAFLGPVFGALAERWELRRAAFLLNAVLAVLSTGVFLLVILFAPPVQLLAAASVLIGVASSLSHPVRLVIISQMVPAEALSSAARHNATTYNLSRVLGPALAGILIAAFGARWSLAANPISFIPLLGVLYTIKLIPRHKGDEPAGPILQSIMEGMAYVRGAPIIAWCMMVTASNAFFARGVLEIIPVIVGDMLRGDSTLLVTTTSASGGAAVIASLLASAFAPTHARAMRLTSLSAIVGSLAILVLGLWPHESVALFALGGASFSATMCAINSQTLVFGLADGAYRARSLTWWSTFSLGASAGGGVALGLLAEFTPLDQVLIAASAVAMCIAAALTMMRPDRQLQIAAPQSGG